VVQHLSPVVVVLGHDLPASLIDLVQERIRRPHTVLRVVLPGAFDLLPIVCARFGDAEVVGVLGVIRKSILLSRYVHELSSRSARTSGAS
jgi:hypothetical protein